ncbi:P-loop containing nucleoside triphosphate hydrolase protein [Xylaria arbuscula]|nr:P-loop containing nucleoside triphosphate hydrolase protein [Xylaria arbuscula]
MPSPIRIAVFGKTGSGKTSFVKCATGADLGVGDGGSSTTKHIQQAVVPPSKVGGRKVILTDTPGFSDTDLEDPELFLKLANWLANSHNQGEPLNGAIFLQPINQARVDKSEREAVTLFENIVGTKGFPQVVVASSLWDTLARTELGAKYESNRKEVWQGLESGGASFSRFHNTEASSLGIVRQFLDFPVTTFQLVEELRRLKGKVWSTSAATFLQESINIKIRDLDEQVKIAGVTAYLNKTLKTLRGWLERFQTAVVSQFRKP